MLRASVRRDPLLPIPRPPWSERHGSQADAMPCGQVRLRLNTGELVWLHGGAIRVPIGRYVPGVGILGDVPADPLTAWAQARVIDLCHAWDNAIAEAMLDPVDDDEARAASRHPWHATHRLHWMGEAPDQGQLVMAVHDPDVPEVWHLWPAMEWTRGDEWTHLAWDERFPPTKRLRIFGSHRRGVFVQRVG